MCQTNCCGRFWSVILVLAHISALSAPWFMWVSRAPVASPCYTRTQLGWSHIDVKSIAIRSEECHGAHVSQHWNWRELCSIARHFDVEANKCESMIRTMDTAVSFTGASFVISIVILALAFRQACNANGRPNGRSHDSSPVARGFMWTGLIGSAVALISFASQFTHAYRRMFGGCRQYEYEVPGSTSPSCPADSLIGGNSFDEYDNLHMSSEFKPVSQADRDAKSTPMMWFPVGFWSVVFIFFCYTILLCTWHAQRRVDDATYDRTRLAAQQAAAGEQPQPVEGCVQTPSPYFAHQPQPILMQQRAEGQVQPAYI